ncbi:MAG: electron transfer flavoprotein subunit alpha/FixB family protein [Anaerolineales bacterium]|jgi:electron transfer flavoprotein alpha subunit
MSQDILVIIEHLQGQVLDISYVMLAAARVLAGGTGGKVNAMLLGKDAQKLAEDLNADAVLYVDDPALSEFVPDAYLQVLAEYIQANQPRAVLMGHTTIGMDVASGLSVRTGVPLVSQCKSVNADGIFTSQICGGKIMAEGSLPEPTALVTMVPGGYKPEEGRSDKTPSITEIPAPDLSKLKIQLKEYIEPEVGDVDIATQDILIAVGRGLQNEGDLELAEELAEAIGGAVCASRPIVDQGWLSTSRLVGKSGKSVKPKLYFAFGISGAPEHLEGVADSDLFVAVNTDPNAPIFNVAQYGIEADLLDLMPALVDQLQDMKV